MALVTVLAAAATAQAQSVTVTCGGASVPSYRWTLEEDSTYQVQPGVADPNTISVSFHRSYMRVVGQGTAADIGRLSTLMVSGRSYFISVLPDSGCTNGGAPIRPGGTDVAIVVDPMPIPTAQISVFVFHDNRPVNNAPDMPEEAGLAGFSIQIEDAGGRYGASAGQQSSDAFGNPLGTDYRTPVSGSCTSYGTTYVLDAAMNLCVRRNPGGVILTDAQGRAQIKNLAPGKYGITAVPPAGQGWMQTATIEGTKIIDAWVKANEPSFFQEFGPPGYHAFIGFVKECSQFTGTPVACVPGTPLLGAGTATISGQVTNLHMSRPPDYSLHVGGALGYTTPIIGLNAMGAGGIPGRGLYVAKTGDEGVFSITGVPVGSYQLVVFDENLDVIFAAKPVSVSANGQLVELGEVPVFTWFGSLHNFVFLDSNGNGFRDQGEPGLSDQNVNIRWRDGTINQLAPTDGTGFVPFDEVFPFFSWLVAEVDFTRMKATGVTVVVDAGGPLQPGSGWTAQAGLPADYESILSPQAQAENGLAPFRTELGPVLTQGFQLFLGQTNVLQWGKKDYDIALGENGGISGVVHYSTTRAENDPAKGGPEVWEPGIADVQVALYQDSTRDGVIDDFNLSTFVELADVDNFPFGWMDGSASKGPEDVDHDGDLNFDWGDAIQIVWTDSWDANLPSSCQGPAGNPAIDGGVQPFMFKGLYAKDCYDGLRNWNQVRPAVFDGGYAFNTRFMAPGGTGDEVPLPPGGYIVRMSPPPGYDLVKEEDKNVDFGIEFRPADTMAVAAALTGPLAFPACVGGIDGVGAPHTVPDQLDLFPGVDVDFASLMSVLAPDIDAIAPGYQRPYCDAKAINLVAGANGAANFFLFTKAPIAGHILGFILDDTANEFDPTAPNFGEKFAPPWLPISIRDWKGREVARTYSDEYGVYNALVPSTFSANLPQPSGMSPSMMTVCLNHATLPDGSPDPRFDKRYSQFCYTFQYMPGTTTYLDTPVIPASAFAGADQNPVDCELPDQTPGIRSASAPVGQAIRGPYVRPTPATPATLVIESMGTVEVPNPLYAGTTYGGPDARLQARTITRNHGFGASTGTVRLGATTLAIQSWSNESISVLVPSTVPSGQLVVTHANGRSSIEGVTVTVAPTTITNVNHPNHPNRVRVVSAPAAPGTFPGAIQTAIDAAGPGDLILVGPGNYEELVVMSKPVRLQGWGPGTTTINAIKAPAEKLEYWRTKVLALVNAQTPSPYLLPGQEQCVPGPGCFSGTEPILLFDEEGSGVLVLAKEVAVGNAERYKLQFEGTGNTNCTQATNFTNPLCRPNARIDGFTITGADHSGGIVVNGYAHWLEISNNRIVNNSGVFGGGIRVGHPEFTTIVGGVEQYTHAQNDNVSIHNNQVSFNGTTIGAGGGMALYTGADSYRVTSNFVCGNFATGGGAGFAHLGDSDRNPPLAQTTPAIVGNTFLFNESFNQGLTVSGGAILIGGAAPIVPAVLSPGSGSVVVDGNLIQGNAAPAGDGGGLRLSQTNRDKIEIYNNIIVNNVAGLAGGGISLHDVENIDIVHNTIAHNDSLGTAGEAFTAGNPQVSNPQPAGIVAHEFSPALKALGGVNDEFPTPKRFTNNIIWRNRAFHYGPTSTFPNFGLLPEDPVSNPDYWDMDVLPFGVGQLNPTYSIVTDPSQFPGQEGNGNTFTNSGVDPGFVASYFNGSRRLTIEAVEAGTILAPAALDEGGNFIRPRFGPLTLMRPDNEGATAPAVGADLSTIFFGNYHITFGLAGQSLDGTVAPLNFDFDRQLRLGTLPPSRGADQLCLTNAGNSGCVLRYPVPEVTTSPLPPIIR